MSNDQEQPKVVPLHPVEDKTVSALYQQAATEQPSAALDAKILHAAHGTIHTDKRYQTAKARSGWIPKASGLAASVLVAASINSDPLRNLNPIVPPVQLPANRPNLPLLHHSCWKTQQPRCGKRLRSCRVNACTARNRRLNLPRSGKPVPIQPPVLNPGL